MASAYICAAQGGKQTGLPKPNGPVGSKDVPNKPPPSLPLPELVVKKIVYDGKVAEPRVLIANVGKTKAKSFELSFGCSFVIGKGTGSDGKPFDLISALPAAPVSVPALNAGAEKWISVGKFGKHSNIKQCGASVDSSKVVTESNELNNDLSIK